MLIVVTLLFLRNIRTAVGPIAILLFSVLFTVLPLVGFRQTINLFSLAGLAIAIGEIADATIVIVENCAAELSLRPAASRDERQEILIRSIASVTKPLLFSLLIILASFLPVFFLEEREARLFDPLAYSKTFAMAFSTLLTLLLLPIIVLWIFKKDQLARQDFQRKRSRSGRIGRCSRTVIRYRYAFTAAGMLVLIPAAVLLSDVSQGLPAGNRRGFDSVHADDAAGTAEPGGGLDPPADGQEAEGASGSRAGVRKDRQGRHVHRSGPAHDDRDDGAPAAESRSGGRA